MKKSDSSRLPFSKEFVLDKYADYLSKKGLTEKSIVKYKGLDAFFECDSFRGQKLTNQERNLLELLPKLICTTNLVGIYKDRKGNQKQGLNGKGILDDIISGIKSELFKNRDLEVKTKTESNHQSYANKFFEFVNELYDKQSDYYFSKLINDYKLMKLDLSAADNAVLGGSEGEIYLHKMLRTKFKSRLRCQDRTSGDKIWLPLRFIGKIYSLDKKECDKTSSIKKINTFSEWLDTLVDGIFVHYEAPKGKVNKICFKDDVSLWLKNKDNNNEFEVWLMKSDGESYPVLTPTGKGNQKDLMKVKSISEIDIDHVKSIDRTLRELSSELKELKKVSDKYKEIQKEEEPDENKAVNELLHRKEKVNLQKLREELNEIRDDGLLRLMDSKCNSRKSNGDTFQEIKKRENGTYFGIIEEGIRMTGEQNCVMTLYQELTDDINRTGNLLVADSNSQDLQGTNIDIVDDFSLLDIVNLI